MLVTLLEGQKFLLPHHFCLTKSSGSWRTSCWNYSVWLGLRGKPKVPLMWQYLSTHNRLLQSGGWEPVQLGGSQGGICQEALQQSQVRAYTNQGKKIILCICFPPSISEQPLCHCYWIFKQRPFTVRKRWRDFTWTPVILYSAQTL